MEIQLTPDGRQSLAIANYYRQIESDRRQAQENMDIAETITAPYVQKIQQRVNEYIANFERDGYPSWKYADVDSDDMYYIEWRISRTVDASAVGGSAEHTFSITLAVSGEGEIDISASIPDLAHTASSLMGTFNLANDIDAYATQPAQVQYERAVHARCMLIIDLVDELLAPTSLPANEA